MLIGIIPLMLNSFERDLFKSFQQQFSQLQLSFVDRGYGECDQYFHGRHRTSMNSRRCSQMVERIAITAIHFVLHTSVKSKLRIECLSWIYPYEDRL